MEHDVSFGRWLQQRRKALDLTQVSLGRCAGCSAETIRKYEADQRRPSAEVALGLAGCLQIAEDERPAFLRFARDGAAMFRPPPGAFTVPLPDRSRLHAAGPAAPLSGTLTLCFTDLEGSTRLLQQCGQQYGPLLADYRQLLRTVFQAHGGREIDTQGDAFFVVFAQAREAFAAVLAAQRALTDHAWPPGVLFRTRMALHTGAPEPTAEGYVGLAVHRAARLCEVGHGGQILLSAATQELLRDDLPAGVALRDLGEHRLKDLPRPEHIFQVVTADLPSDFPPLRALVGDRSNLPAQPTSLIGRERDVAAVSALLRRPDVRLVTLSGPGGSGKTRLALQVAADLLAAVATDVCFVDLAPITDPALVAATTATTLGVREAGGHPLVDTLRAFLREKQLLLVLDNFEQVVVAAPLIADLLKAASNLKVLVTSRAVLHLSGEHAFPVPPLAVPDPKHVPEMAVLTEYAAVALFIQRAQAVKPDFQVTNANAPAVAAICAQLDGLPLAIELAAARSNLLSPEALLQRLSSRLTLLTGGARDLPARQQTLRSTIAWSYNLLEAAEQRLFARLAIFVGSWTLEAAEAICGAQGDLHCAVLDGLQSLVDESLVRRVDTDAGEPRFTMLETIREYALEQLDASGELEILRRRHASFFIMLVEATQPALIGPQQVMWLDRLEVEHPNLRAALAWSHTAADDDSGLRLAVALGEFWARRSYLSEGRRWLAEALTQREQGVSSGPYTGTYLALRAQALRYTGLLAMWQGDLGAARAAVEASLALFQELGDSAGIAREISNLGMVFLNLGDHERAGVLLEESLALSRKLGDVLLIAWNLFFLGMLAYIQGHARQAGQLWEESLTRFRAEEEIWGIATLLTHLSMVALDQGDGGRAGALLAESLTLFRELHHPLMTALALELFAGLVAAQGERPGERQGSGLRTARILGAAEALHETFGAGRQMISRDHYQRAVAAARGQVDEVTFAAAWAEGRAMTLEQAIAYALADEGRTVAQPPSRLGSLTEREREVAALIAQGETNRAIAAALIISERTVERHVANIFAKLDLSSRTQIAALAVEAGLTHHGA